jgi:hypothetical protein
MSMPPHGGSCRAAAVVVGQRQAMTSSAFMPPSEGLRRAIAWLAEQGGWTARLVEEACQQFDVTPADEEFLYREMHRQHEDEQRQRRVSPPA